MNRPENSKRIHFVMLTIIMPVVALFMLFPKNAGATESGSQTAVLLAANIVIEPGETVAGNAGDLLQLPHWITNTGTSVGNFTLTSTSRFTWVVSVSPTQVSLAAGASQLVTVSVNIPTSSPVSVVDEVTTTVGLDGNGSVFTKTMDTVVTIQPVNSVDRGRPSIAWNQGEDPTMQAFTLLSDNGLRLRGEHVRLSYLPVDESPPGPHASWIERAKDIEVWVDFAEDFNLNLARLVLYQPSYQYSCVDRCYDTAIDTIPDLDEIVDIASEMGMYVVIDFHTLGGYVVEDATEWWSIIAPRYQNRTHVMYEVANEPGRWAANAYNAELIQFQEDMYTLIRGYAPNSHISLWSFANAHGTGNGSMLNKVNQGVDIDYSNASAAYHPYNNINRPEYITAVIDLQNADYPVFVTEIGHGIGGTALSRTEEAEDLGVGWSWLEGVFDVLNGDNFVTWTGDPRAKRPTILTPTISPNGGTFGSPTVVSLTTGTKAVSLYFTYDGSEPTLANSVLYTQPFTIPVGIDVTIKVMGAKYGYYTSTITLADFSIGNPLAIDLNWVSAEETAVVFPLFLLMLIPVGLLLVWVLLRKERMVHD